MKAINIFLFIPLIALTTVSADVTQHPSYPFDEGNHWTDSQARFSMEPVLINGEDVSQHPFYPFDHGNYWTDAIGGASGMNYRMVAQLEGEQHPFYPFDEEPRL